MPNDGDLYPKVAFAFLSFSCGLGWAVAVWRPLWNRLLKAQESLPTPFILGIMGFAGLMLSVPFGVVEFIAAQTLLVSFFAGVFGGISGVLGAAFLWMFRTK